MATRTVHRAALIRRLDRLAALTVVQALPGYGKTNLVGSWVRGLRNSGTVVEWIDAAPGATSPAAILERVAGALARAADNLEVVVVIDHADCVDDPDTLDEVIALLSQESSLHVVVCSRLAHPIRAIADDRGVDVNLLTGHDLALTAEELPRFAEAWGHDLTSEQVTEVLGLAGGWLLPTRMIFDDTRPGANNFTADAAERYLRAVILPQVAKQDELSIALRLAQTDTVTEKSAARLLTDPTIGSALFAGYSPIEAIDEFVRIGLLEPLKPSRLGREWRFPALVRAVLIDVFDEREPDERMSIHRILARLYWDGTVEGLRRVLVHARLGDDWALLNQLSSAHWQTLTFDLPCETAAAYSSIPAAVLARQPGLAMAAAMAAALVSRPEEGNRRTLLRGLMGAHPDEGALDFAAHSSTDDLSNVTVARMISLRSAGRFAEALELATRLDVEIASRRARGFVDVAPAQASWFPMQWGMTALLAGDLGRAVQLSIRAFEVALGDDATFIASNAASQLSLLHTLSGESVDAQRWLEAHLRFDTRDTWVDYLIGLPAVIAAAHRALDRLDPDASHAQLAAAGDAASPVEMWAFIAEAATRHALLFGEPIVMLAQLDHWSVVHSQSLANGLAPRIIERCSVDLLLAMGELNRAHRRLSDGAGGPTSAIARARLQLMADNPGDAKEIATALLWHPGTLGRERIDLLMILALAQLALGEHSGAAESFTRAHALARHVGTLTPYALIPAEDLAELTTLTGIELSAADRERLSRVRGVFPRRASLIALTAREEAVLRELELTDSFAAIAGSLTVSVNTVKKQAASIYSKLGVHDRLSALARAHQLGLTSLPPV